MLIPRDRTRNFNSHHLLRVLVLLLLLNLLLVPSFLILISRAAISPAIWQVNTTNSTSEATWDSELAGSANRTRRGVKLTLREVRAIIDIWGLPPFLTACQAARLYQRSIGVLRNHVSEGRFPRSAIVGKPLMFVTVHFIREIAARAEGGRR